MHNSGSRMHKRLKVLAAMEGQLNDLILSVNRNLQGVDFETWLENPIWHERFPQEAEDGMKTYRAVFLGFACVDGRWQLVTGKGTYKCENSTDEDGEAKERATDLAAVRPLTGMPRYIRATATHSFSALIAEISLELEGMVEGLERAVRHRFEG
jgi:hypothetical protein